MVVAQPSAVVLRCGGGVRVVSIVCGCLFGCCSAQIRFGLGPFRVSRPQAASSQYGGSLFDAGGSSAVTLAAVLFLSFHVLSTGSVSLLFSLVCCVSGSVVRFGDRLLFCVLLTGVFFSFSVIVGRQCLRRCVFSIFFFCLIGDWVALDLYRAWDSKTQKGMVTNVFDSSLDLSSYASV